MTEPPILITLSGLPASGTTTLSGRLADEFHFEVLNGGDIFREMAAEREMTVPEFTKLADENDQIDKAVDGRLTEVIDAHLEGRRDPDGDGLVVESRLAGWHADGRADISVWLDAPVEVRADRLQGRMETSDELRAREKRDARRYEKFYNIDIYDRSIYDLALDTGTHSETGVFRIVRESIRDVTAPSE